MIGEKKEKKAEQERERSKPRGRGSVHWRREKWQTLSCHEALDVFILPQAVLRERRIRCSLVGRGFTKSFKFVRTVYELDVVKGCRLRSTGFNLAASGDLLESRDPTAYFLP